MANKSMYRRIFFRVDKADFYVECRTAEYDAAYENNIICTFHNDRLFDKILAFAIEHNLDVARYSKQIVLFIPFEYVYSYGQFEELELGFEKLETA